MLQQMMTTLQWEFNAKETDVLMNLLADVDQNGTGTAFTALTTSHTAKYLLSMRLRMMNPWRLGGRRHDKNWTN